MDVTAGVATVCTVLAVSLIWPQVVRVYRLDSVEGLAVGGTLHGLAGCVVWTIYGVAQGIVPVTLANVSIGSALVAIALAQVRHRVMPAPAVLGVLAGMSVIGFLTLHVSVTLTGWLAIVLATTSIVPQIVKAARAEDLTAVSVPMYLLMASNAVLWIVYGLAIGDTMVVLTNLWFVPCAAFVAFRSIRFQQLALRAM